MRVVPLPPPPRPPAHPPFSHNERIYSRASLRGQRSHGKFTRRNGVQHGERSPDRANTPTLQNFGFLFATPFCKPRVGFIYERYTSLHQTMGGGGKRGKGKRRNSLVGLSVSRAPDFCFGTRYTRVSEYLMRLMWLLMRTLLCAVNTGGYPGARLMPMWH